MLLFNMFMRLSYMFVFAFLSLGSGCATVINGQYQEIEIFAEGGNNLDKIKCVAKNNQGDWTFPVLKPISVHRDYSPISVQCKNDEQIGEQIIQPKNQFLYYIADILLLAPVSHIVDWNSKATYSYPSTIKLKMIDKKK